MDSWRIYWRRAIQHSDGALGLNGQGNITSPDIFEVINPSDAEEFSDKNLRHGCG
jgi:hypothetical protein